VLNAEKLNQFTGDDVAPALNVRALPLPFVSVTRGDETWVPVPAKVTGLGEADRLPPPPPLLEPLKVTVIVVPVAVLGEVGVRSTVAVAPLFTPDKLLVLKNSVFGVVELPVGWTSQLWFVEPLVSPL
jgi:hypothetical protein